MGPSGEAQAQPPGILTGSVEDDKHNLVLEGRMTG